MKLIFLKIRLLGANCTCSTMERNGLTFKLHFVHKKKNFRVVDSPFLNFFQEVVLEQSKTRVYASAAPARPSNSNLSSFKP